MVPFIGSSGRRCQRGREKKKERERERESDRDTTVIV